jgi:hypothetical protein
MSDHLKRDNWTNEEVMDLLKGMRITGMKVNPPRVAYLESYNEGLQDAVETFFDFTRPMSESGAMAYDTEKKEIVHVGPLLPR